MSIDMITIGGMRYWIAPVVEGECAPAAMQYAEGKMQKSDTAGVPQSASVRGAFKRAVADRLATGENWRLADIAQAKGCAIGTVRKYVGGILQEATPQQRKRGRIIACTSRSVARFLGEATR
ncbi:MAG: hypothetical protein RL077_333 [Verrucomicrobiota bacterium]|jgi:hypothetical protein